jgi:hypothetical protein
MNRPAFTILETGIYYNNPVKSPHRYEWWEWPLYLGILAAGLMVVIFRHKLGF